MSFQGTNCLPVNKVQTTGCIAVQPLLLYYEGRYRGHTITAKKSESNFSCDKRLSELSSIITHTSCICLSKICLSKFKSTRTFYPSASVQCNVFYAYYYYYYYYYYYQEHLLLFMTCFNDFSFPTIVSSYQNFCYLFA